jgi:hypothetical protein
LRRCFNRQLNSLISHDQAMMTRTNSLSIAAYLLPNLHPNPQRILVIVWFMGGLTSTCSLFILAFNT